MGPMVCYSTQYIATREIPGPRLIWRSRADRLGTTQRIGMFLPTFLLCFLVVPNNLASGQEADTTNGRVRGKTITVSGTSLDVFHGIPFAKPPVGARRFKHPEAADSWSPDVKDVVTEKPSCVQSTSEYAHLTAGDPRRLPGGTSEDCLYLSVWKPSSANPGSNKAVMVWIYGGSFTIGGTSVPLYNGQYMAAENDVIVVSINYRLGPLGFAFLDPGTIPGNMGLMDQVEGIKWVKNNIANFGGDPNKITLFGESAGSYSIGYHLLSNISQDLFNNAILQSGAPVSKLFTDLLHTKSEGRAFVKKLAKTIPCSGSSDADIYTCLMAATPSSITTAFGKLDPFLDTVNPVVDGYFILDDPITLMDRGEYKKTSIITGVTKDELTSSFDYLFNPVDRVVYETGIKFGESDFSCAVVKLTELRDVGRINSLKSFYEREQSPPRDYAQILNYAGSDVVFKCPTLLFSSLYAQTNNVYLYSLDYRVSNLPLPAWMGVPHTYDIDLVLGLPFSDSPGFNVQDKEMSRIIMKYWSNFAKSGDPNSPESVTTNWELFNSANQTYLALDVGSNLATRHGFRRQQCAFVNDVLPTVPKDVNKLLAAAICSSGSRRLYTGSSSIVVSLITVFYWMLQLT